MRYEERIHDDCDGEYEQKLEVTQTDDGDVWINIGFGGECLRFRTEFGGGMSPNIHAALLNLLNAMEKDNNERPQDYAYCRLCGQHLFGDEKDQICGTCVGEIKHGIRPNPKD